MYTMIEMDSYKRRAHFDYFRSLAYPYVGVTVNVDITDFLAAVRENSYPFFLSFCYCVVRAANSVPEFRQRIVDGAIKEYDWCSGSHTVALDDGTYCYCVLDSALPFDEYLPRAVTAQDEAAVKASLEDGEDSDSLLFLSTLPGISYTALVQPVPSPADSNPRISWGKYFEQNGKQLIPLSLLCHHALVDGLHMSRFYDALDAELKKISHSFYCADKA